MRALERHAAIALCGVAIAVAQPALADEPAYRFQAPITVEKSAAFVQLPLPASAYARSLSSGLNDLRVVDARGERVPFAVLEAALVRFVIEAAPRCSLAHDVSDGGLAVALAEAALHSGVGARLDLSLDPASLFGEGCGQVILALPALEGETDPLGSDVGVRRIGEVGGDEILGVTLARLRAVWEREI